MEAEIQRIESMGVTIHLNKKVEDLEQVMKEGKFDAVFLAVGAHLNKRMDLPGRDAGRMIDALSFLRTMDGPSPLKIGKRVLCAIRHTSYVIRMEFSTTGLFIAELGAWTGGDYVLLENDFLHALF